MKNELKNYIKIDKILYIIAFLFFAIPITILFVFWYKLYLSIPAIVIIYYCGYKLIKNIKYKSLEQYKSIFNKKKIIIILILLLGLNYMSGIGGYTYQNGDHNARNAVLHDLIDYKWPVKYDYNNDIVLKEKIGEIGYFSYYFTYFLPAASVGKLSGFEVASLVMFVYQYIGLILIYYFMSRLFNKIKIWYFFLFCAFSGLDIVGYSIINRDLTLAGTTHIDTWAGYFCTSSNLTQLFWVFNQGITSWLITMLLFNEKTFENVGILMLFILAFSPFPAVGYFILIIMLLFLGIYDFENKKIDNKGFIYNFKQMFSKQNLFSVIPILLICIFLTINPSGQYHGFIFEKYDFNIYGLSILKRYLLYLLLEFGICSIIITSKKNLKYVIGLSLVLAILPLYYLGSGCDFVNRVSLPILTSQMLLLMERLKNLNYKNYRFILIIVYLLIACITPKCEVKRTMVATRDNKFKIVYNRNDHWKTYGRVISDDVLIYIKNFSTNYDKEKFIFKYIFR